MLELLTLLLACATVWLAWETRKMAIASAETVELQGSAYLSIEDIEHQFLMLATPSLEGGEQTPQEGLQIKIRLGNPGAIPVNYHVNRVSESITFPRADMSRFATTGGVIFPKTSSYFILPEATTAHPKPGGLAPQSEIEIDITYSPSSHGKRWRLRAKIRGQILDRVHWHYVEGPSYSKVSV